MLHVSPEKEIQTHEIGEMVNETVVETEDLVAKITVAADTIANMPGIFEWTRQSMVRQCTACIKTKGRVFEQFL